MQLETSSSIELRLERITKLLSVIACEIKKQDTESELATDLQKVVYALCDGRRSAAEIAQAARTNRVRVAQLLPSWEEKGILISIGEGASKRYLNLRAAASIGKEVT